jgi:hypothetical protein
MLIVSRRNYLVCFERFAGLRRGAARCLLQLIVRISPKKTSQSLICETSTVGVKLLAVNRWSCVFAA